MKSVGHAGYPLLSNYTAADLDTQAITPWSGELSARRRPAESGCGHLFGMPVSVFAWLRACIFPHERSISSTFRFSNWLIVGAWPLTQNAPQGQEQQGSGLAMAAS
jgi:hypothetical protein